MKRRVSRDISIFNLSMLDVICSALGAIVILFILSDQARTEAVGELSKADKAVSAMKAEQMKARAKLNMTYQSRIHQLEEQVEQLKDKVATLSKGESKSSLKKRLSRLQKDMKGIKKDWRDKKAMQRRMAQLLQMVDQLKKRQKQGGMRGSKRLRIWYGSGTAWLTDVKDGVYGWRKRYRCSKVSGGHVCTRGVHRNCTGPPTLKRGGVVVK